MSTKKYTCNLCASGTTKSNYENHGCCAKCKDKIEKAKKDGKNCAICKLTDNEKFIKFNGLCINCNNIRCGLLSDKMNTQTTEIKTAEPDKPESEGVQPGDSDSEKASLTKKEVVDVLISSIVQAYAEMGLDKSVTKTGFALSLKTTLNDFLENELNN